MGRSILVLGAGMVGTCTALHLQQRGYEVVLVDRRAPGLETSLGNAGLIQREAVEPYASGEVSFHLGWTLHRAGPNTTTRPRRVHTVIYMDEAMRLADTKLQVRCRFVAREELEKY